MNTLPRDVVLDVLGRLGLSDRFNFVQAAPEYENELTAADRDLVLLEYAFKAGTLEPTKSVVDALVRHDTHPAAAKMLDAFEQGDWVKLYRLKAAMTLGTAAGYSRLRKFDPISNVAKAVVQHAATLTPGQFDAFYGSAHFHVFRRDSWLVQVFFETCNADLFVDVVGQLHSRAYVEGIQRDSFLERVTPVIAMRCGLTQPSPQCSSSAIRLFINRGHNGAAQRLLDRGFRLTESDDTPPLRVPGVLV